MDVYHLVIKLEHPGGSDERDVETIIKCIW